VIDTRIEIPEGILPTDDLPDGWTLTTAGSIADVVGGGTPKSSESENFSEVGHPWITPADLSGFRELYIRRGRRDLSDKGLRSCSAVLMPAGTVLMSSRAPIGYVAIAANDVCTNQGFKSFVCDSGINPEFVYFWLRLITPHLEQMGSGSTFTEISGSRAKEIPMLLAPTFEQRRIAEQIKRILPTIDSVRDRLSRVPTILKRFRQAVLAAACSGRLTEGWREEHRGLPPVERLYARAQELRAARHKQNCDTAVSNGMRQPADPRKSERSDKPVVDLPEFPREWGLYPLQDLSHLVTDGTHKTPTYRDQGIAFLSVKNVRPFNVLDANVKRISIEEHRAINHRCNPENGDILYTKVGATFGYAAVNRLRYPFSLFVSVALVKVVQECFVPEYAEIVMNSDITYRQAADRVSGSGTPDLHLVEIRDFRIPLPPLEEQAEIIRRVHRLFQLAAAIETRVTRARVRTDKLTQSILAKAFRGELVPTEAELARREGREYEPASVLLERIRKERESLPDMKRKQIRKSHLRNRASAVRANE
jgi:type I restriction enzyme, S subunit